MQRVLALALAMTLAGSALEGQAVPDDAPATRVSMGYRRTSQFRSDPFRHAMVPHWGLVFSGGLTSENNAFALSDLGSVKFLNDEDAFLLGDVLDLINLIPSSQGLGANGQGEAGVSLSAAISSRIGVAFSAQLRGYGTFALDDDAVALLRDGNGARSEFTLGESQATGIATGEAGVHATYRTGPVGTPDGVQLVFGVGTRYVRPAGYVHASSLLNNGGRVQVTNDSVNANIDLQVVFTNLDEAGDFFDRVTGGSGSFVGDFLIRGEWPTSGFSVEALVANVGSVTVVEVERKRAQVDLATTNVDDVSELLDTLELAIQDTVDVAVTLPKIIRFSASAWANSILQLDLSATAPVSGEFDTPLAVDLGTTWRFLRHFPLRAGVVLGGHQGIGYTGGFALESRNLLFQVAAQSLGGLFRDARGLGARFDLGFYF